MFNISIIGAGQLGSRHLQGLKTAKLDMKIEVVDTSEDSLSMSRLRYEQVSNNNQVKDIRFIKSIAELSDELDLVIIATGSGPRCAITKELIKNKKIKNIIFEKVLFQKIEDYTEIENLLVDNNINAWVNCTRRMYSFYNDLKERFFDSNKLILSVTGGNWGLGCNSIHFIDLLAYISNAKQYEVKASALDPEFLSSKRVGYVEFSGVLSATTERGDILTLMSQKGSIAPTIVTIQSDKLTVIIDETNQVMYSLESGKCVKSDIQLPYQSQLTGIVAEEILLQRISSLTTFKESRTLHLAFMKPVLKFYNNINRLDSKICPIT